MTTSQLVITIVVAALLSSAVTVLVLGLAARSFLRRHRERMVDEAGDAIASKVHDAVEQAGEELAPRFRAEVRQGFEEATEEVLPRLRAEVAGGVEDAAEGLIPRLREEVQEGFAQGVKSVVGRTVLGDRGEELARKGTSVLEAGLNLVFGSDDEDSD